MAREASRGSFLSATFSLLACVAPAEFDADFVKPRFQCAVEFVIRGGQRVGQLLDAACAKNDRSYGRVCQHPSDGQGRDWRSILLGDFLNPGDCFKLALVPIAGLIRLPEPAEFGRKATLL